MRMTFDRARTMSVALAAVLVFGACGGSETVDDSEDPADESAVEDEAADDGSDFSTIDSMTLRTLQLPEGVRAFVANDQSIGFGNARYLVTLRADGVRLIVVDSDGARDTDAFIAGARFGEVFHSGTRIVMTGSDEAGDLVVLSSEDGVTFTEARIATPDRYVDADVWAATTLVADVGGVADLDGDLFVIAQVGINWRAASGVVADFAYTISEEVGDAARFAGIVSAAPKGDGDTLYTFKADGEVVFESLGSEAGVEPGYVDAYEEAFSADSDSGFHGGWVISGTTATQTEIPPLNGELDEDVRLLQLYSVGEGVAALVWDLSPEATGPQYYMSGGAGSFGPLVAAAYASKWKYSLYSWFGENVWESAHDSLGDPRGGRPKILINDGSDGAVLVQKVADGLNIAQSDDALDWNEFRHADYAYVENDQLEVARANNETYYMVVSPEEEGGHRVFRVTPPDDGFEDAFVEEIDIKTGEPIESDIEPGTPPVDDPMSPETTDTVEFAETSPAEDFLMGIGFGSTSWGTP